MSLGNISFTKYSISEQPIGIKGYYSHHHGDLQKIHNINDLKVLQANFIPEVGYDKINNIII